MGQLFETTECRPAWDAVELLDELGTSVGEDTHLWVEAEPIDADVEPPLFRAHLISPAEHGDGAKPITLASELTKTTLEGCAVRITQRFVPGGFGCDDYEDDHGLPIEMAAFFASKKIGSLTAYILRGEEGDNRIHFIEVDEAHRRRGCGSLLLDAFEGEHGAVWETNGLTDDGTALIAARG